MVAMMQIIISHVVIIQSTQIVLSEGPIDIADDKTILVSIKVYFCLNPEFFNFVFDSIFAVFQVQWFQLLWCQLWGLQIANVIYSEFYLVIQDLIDVYLDFATTFGVGRVRPNADKKLGGTELPSLMFDHDHVRYTLHQTGFVQGRTKYVDCFATTSEHTDCP